MDDMIRFVEGGELTLDLVPHCAWSMLLVQMTLVSARWTCFFGLDECFEVTVYDDPHILICHVQYMITYRPILYVLSNIQ